MKKFVALVIMAILFISMFVSCGQNRTYEEIEFEAVVINCEEGTFHEDASYMAIANMYFTQNNLAMWSFYKTLARANGKYDYNITISIGEENYTVVREEQYEVGQYITVIQVNTYMDSQLVKTEYK